MKKFGKISAIFLAIAIALTFAACSAPSAPALDPTDGDKVDDGGDKPSITIPTDDDKVDDGDDKPSITIPTDEGQDLCIMSYNLRCSDVNGSYGDRRVRVAEIINEQNPDSFGVQEATPEWLTALSERVENYEYVGSGRDANGGGEASAVYYRKDKYKLLDSATKWLSDTPDVPGSRFVGEEYIRIVTYAVLQNKTTGSVYVHVNTHLGLDASVRLQQIEVLLNVITDYVDNYPTFVTGDFNDYAQDNAAHKMIENGFSDSRLEAPITDDHHTFPTPLYGNTSDKEFIIDYCFFNNNFKAEKYSVIAKQSSDDGWSSDHYPIAIRGKLTNPDFQQTLIPNITSIEIDGSATFFIGEDMSKTTFRVYGNLKNETRVVLPTTLYNITQPSGSATDESYTVTAELKGVESVTDSKTVAVLSVFQAENAILAGFAANGGSKPDQIDYEKDQNGDLVDSGRKVTYVGGLDYAVSQGNTPSLTFNFNASQGEYNLKIRVASTWFSFKTDSGTSSEVVLSKVLKLKVNGTYVTVKDSVQPSLTGTYGQIGRTFYLLDFADITLKNGSNSIVIEGFCTEYDKNQQKFDQYPVPNIDYIKFEKTA